MATDHAQWIGTASIRGSSESMRMALLTFSLIGLQFTWGVEMTYCTPYLLQLGMSKSKLSLVWIAGPLSGLIMQPIVGILADKSKSKYGRRRPYMIGGSVVVALCLFILGWAAEITGIVFSEHETKREATIVLAVLAIYALDFAINVVQSSCRSLVVDTLPIAKQQAGSAWGECNPTRRYMWEPQVLSPEASRMVAIGHLVVYGVGAIDLQASFGHAFGDTQFKQLIFIAAFALLVAVGVTSYAVTERVLISDGSDAMAKGNTVTSSIRTIIHTTMYLPPRVQRICNIQFWAWIAWFPFLFYSSTWVGETYLRHDAPPAIRDSPDAMSIVGRVGSRTLILFSCVTFAASVLLPYAVRSPEDSRSVARRRRHSRDWSSSPISPAVITPRPPAVLAPLAPYLPTTKPTLLTAWLASHLLFAATVVFAPLVGSVHAASLIVTLCGLPWALASWAPFTFLGVEINRLGNGSSTTSSSASVPLASLEAGGGGGDVDSDDEAAEMMHLSGNGGATRPRSATDADADAQPAQLAGVYLGILNLYTTLPQFVASAISTVVFAVFEPGKDDNAEESGRFTGTEGISGIAVCLFIGGWASLIAAWSTRRMGRN